MSRGSLARIPAPVALSVLVAMSAALRFAAARAVPSPWIAPDEMLYALLGRALWEEGRLSVLGGETPFYSLVYPALAGLPLSLGSVASGYTALKALQAVVMSLAAVPVYLWGRRLVRPRWALAAAALTLAIPGLAYAGTIMTEVAFYPVFVLAAWATAAALERPTLGRQALLVGAVALASATRLQALVLVPAVLTAIGVKALLDRELRRVRAYWPTAAAALAALAWFALRRSSGLGGYAAAAETSSYSAGESARYVLYHAADLALLTGVLPLCALALLAVRAFARPDTSNAVRAYLAVASAFVGWIVVEVGVFASAHAERIEERDLLGLAPLLFLALAVWLDRGAPRRYAEAAAIALAVAALVLLLPYDRFVTIEASADSPTLAAVLRLAGPEGALDPTAVVALPAAALAAAFALVPRRALPALAALAGSALVAASVAASLQFADEAALRQARLVGPEPRWVDRAANAPVAYVFGESAFWNAVWAHLFWNRSIAGVYHLGAAAVPGAVPQQRVELRDDGVLRARGRAIPYRYALLPTDLVAAGEVVSTTEFEGSDVVGLHLWRLEGTPRVLERVTGLQPNGDVFRHAIVRAFACTGGSFVVTLLGKTDATVEVRLDGRTVETVATTAGSVDTLVLPTRPARTDGTAACTLELLPTDLVGVTQLEFAR